MTPDGTPPTAVETVAEHIARQETLPWQPLAQRAEQIVVALRLRGHMPLHPTSRRRDDGLMSCQQMAPDGYARCGLRGPNHPTCRGWDEMKDQWVDWTNEGYVKPATVSPAEARSRLQEMAARVLPADRVKELVVDSQERPADGWDDEQRKLVFDCIVAVATRCDEFTMDDVWDELAGRVPVVQSAMRKAFALASRRDVLGHTGKQGPKSRRAGGQMWEIWFSLIWDSRASR